MAPKVIRTKFGKATIKSIQLKNGNLLIPARSEEDREDIIWKEVPPGTSEFKRWAQVAVQEPDPRKRVRRKRSTK
jgi:hypothetical protein